MKNWHGHVLLTITLSCLMWAGGCGQGGGSHSLAEWYDDGTNGWLGPQWAALLIAALAGAR